MIRITMPHFVEMDLQRDVKEQIWITDEDTGRIVAEVHHLRVHVFEDIKEHRSGFTGRLIKRVKKPKEITITIRCRSVPTEDVLAIEHQRLIPKL